MNDNFFIMGFCKAAEEHGVDPIKLAKSAAINLVFDPKIGRYRNMTPTEQLAATYIGPKQTPREGIDLQYTMNANVERNRKIREMGKQLALDDVNPSRKDMEELSLKNLVDSLDVVEDSRPDAWKKVTPSVWSMMSNGMTPIDSVLRAVTDQPIDPLASSAAKSMYSGYTNALERIRKGEITSPTVSK